MKPIVTCRSLSTIGRWGNACFLYCFAKAYARKFNCELQVGDWIGRKILANSDDPFVAPENAHFPQTKLDSHTNEPLDRYFGRSEIDLFVYGQHNVYQSLYSRADAREWLKLKPEYEALKPAVPPVSVAHIRRGDIVENSTYAKLYCSISENSYDDAIEQFGIPKPVVKVFEGWRPNPPNTPPEAQWLPDFLFLRDAQYLLRANSTFSYFAGLLGYGKVFSPLVEDKVGWNYVPFTEGNHANTAGRFANQSDLILSEQ